MELSSLVLKISGLNFGLVLVLCSLNCRWSILRNF